MLLSFDPTFGNGNALSGWHQKLQPSINITELCSFIALRKVFRRVVPNFSKIVVLLSNKLNEDGANLNKVLTTEELSAMHELEKELVSQPILLLPNAKRKHPLNTNACNVQIECMLLQEHHDGTTNLIEYWSRLLSKAKQAYETAQREFFLQLFGL